MNDLEDRTRVHDGRMQRGYMRNEGHHVGISCGDFNFGAMTSRQEIFDAKQLRGEDTIERGEAEPTLTTDEIGKM